MTRAQGQATTSTETARMRLKVKGFALLPAGSCSGPTAPEPSRASQSRRVEPLRAMTAGTKRPETRSANSCTGALCACACSTRLTICASAELSPTAWRRTCSVPPWLAVPPTTLSPGPFATGRDSPVIADSSTADSPATTMPSAGTFAPGSTRTRSPLSSSRASTSRSRPGASPSSSNSSAVRGCRAMSAVMASPVLPLARDSSHLPRSTNVSSKAEVSKSRPMAAISPAQSFANSSAQEET
mmetsp:Transcript_47501/g.114008  ORF Transcript_47501/g.114008 Transcript_47501/m.114008 type:complete len:242 (-) Transcript_47501:566-1291(-)